MTTDADVREAPTFATLAPNLVRRLDDCDLAGFGIAGFDLPPSMAERPPLDDDYLSRLGRAKGRRHHSHNPRE